MDQKTIRDQYYLMINELNKGVEAGQDLYAYLNKTDIDWKIAQNKADTMRKLLTNGLNRLKMFKSGDNPFV